MSTDIALTYGSHHRIVQKVGKINVSVTEDREVELDASFLPDPMVSAPASLMATPWPSQWGSIGCHGAFLAASRDIPENGLAAATIRRKPSLRACARVGSVHNGRSSANAWPQNKHASPTIQRNTNASSKPRVRPKPMKRGKGQIERSTRLQSAEFSLPKRTDCNYALGSA